MISDFGLRVFERFLKAAAKCDSFLGEGKVGV